MGEDPSRESILTSQANTAQDPTQPIVGVAKTSTDAVRPFSNANQASLLLSLNDSVVKDPIAPLAAPDAAEGAFVSRHPYSGEEIVVLPGPSPRPAYERSLFVTGLVDTTIYGNTIELPCGTDRSFPGHTA